MGLADDVFAAAGACCFRTKKKVAATRMIAAAETRISVVEFDLAGRFGWDGAVALAAGTEGASAGTVACASETCRSGEAVETLAVGAMLGGTLRAGTLVGGTMPAGTFAGGIGSGATLLGGTSFGKTWFGKTSGKTGLAGIWPVSAPEGGGALGRGT